MKSPWLIAVLAIALGAALALTYARPIQAQSAAPLTGKIACVDVGVVFDEYQRLRDLNEEVKALQDKLKTEELDRRNKIEAARAELDALGDDDPTYRERARNVLAMQIDYKNWGDLKQADLSRELALWTVSSYKEVLDMVADVAQHEGYDMVFYKGQFDPPRMDMDTISDQIRNQKLLYANAATDLTQTVLDRLNAKYRNEPHKPMLWVP